MADITLRAQRRTLMGKKLGALRRQGLIPANIYGGSSGESVPIQFDLQSLREVLIKAGTSTVVDVQVSGVGGASDGQSHPALIEHVSRHPASGQVLHVDLRQVDLNRTIRTAIPVHVEGEAPAVHQGGVLMIAVDTLEVESLPRDLPHAITVDVSVLDDMEKTITVADLPLPPGVITHTDPEMLVARVVMSKLEQEVEAEAAEAAEALQVSLPGTPEATEAPGAAAESNATAEGATAGGATAGGDAGAGGASA